MSRYYVFEYGLTRLPVAGLANRSTDLDDAATHEQDNNRQKRRDHTPSGQ